MLRNCIIQFDSFSEILAFKLFVRMRNLTQVALIIKQQQGAVHGALKCEKCTSALSCVIDIASVELNLKLDACAYPMVKHVSK